MANNRLILRTLNSPWIVPAPDLTKGSVLTHSEVDNNFIYLKGEDIYSVDSSPSIIKLNKVNGSSLTISLSASTNTYTSGTTIVGNTIYFDRNDSLSAYTADLTSVLSGVTLTDGNGTTASGNSVGLGGALTSNAVISGGGKNLELGTSTNLLNDIKINSTTGSETYSGGSLTNIASNTPTSFDRKVTDGDAVTLFEAYSNSLDLKATKPTLSGESRVYINPTQVEITQTNTSTTKGGRLQITPNNSIYTYTNGTGITSGLLMSSSSVNLSINETGGGNSGLILKPEESLVFTDNASLKLTPSATTFTDGRVTTKGIEYAADYSTGWTANSLVTKGYVDSGSTMPAYSFKANITSGVAAPTDVAYGDLTNTLPDSADGIIGFDTATNAIVRFPASKLLNVQFAGTTTSGSAGISVDSMQLWYASALSQNIIFGVPGGTPTESQQLRIRLKDNGTARTITWNAIFTANANIPLPTTTVVGETLFLTFVFNAVVSKWQLIQSTQSGGGSGNTIYSANGTLTSNRIIDMSSYGLSFDGNNSGTITTNFSGRTAFISNRTTGEANILEIQDNSNNRIFEVRQNNSVHLNAQGTGDVVIGADAQIGTEKISLQGNTLIKGSNNSAATSGFKFIDSNDDSKWDFRNNGDVVVGQDIKFIGDSASVSNLKLYRPANVVNYGAGFDVDLSNSASAQKNYGRFGAQIVTNTSGSEYGKSYVAAAKNGTTTIIAEFDSANGLSVLEGGANSISTSTVPSFTAKSDGATDGYIQLNCTANTHGIKLKSPPHSATASYTLTFPDDAGSNGQVLQTDGSGNLSWGTGGGTSTLNNGDIFVGNASNVATSVGMTGDTTISNTGVVTIGSDKVTYDKMQDVTTKSVLGNSTGAGTIAEIPIIEHYLPAGNANIALLNLTTNWDVNGNYTGGTAITLTYQGQSHYNSDYWFTAVADNTWIRLIRG